MPVRGNRKGAAAAAAERRVKVLEMRKAGFTFRQIGGQLDINEAQAYRDLARILSDILELARPDAVALRTLELERLDDLQKTLWRQAKAGNLGATDRLLRIMERRARLLGLDAPTKEEHSGPGGGPIVIANAMDLSRLSDQELQSLERLVGKAALPAPDAVRDTAGVGEA